MGIKQLYNDNLRKLPKEYGDVSVMAFAQTFANTFVHTVLVKKDRHVDISGVLSHYDVAMT